ncbi:MAG: site-2 protease family protein [Patescibacteria group bacterium]|nr:site-2 protease family protein [Patescibacteria group bacterium]
MIFLTIVLFILILGLLVFVHELGHFVAAKKAGMSVEEFGFGFPPRLLGLKKVSGRWKVFFGRNRTSSEKAGEKTGAAPTVYSINWIPLGGFVKILGENGESREPGAFSSKSFTRRFLVLIAGVSMNVVLAWVLLSVTLALGLPTQIADGEQLSGGARISSPQVTILYVESESPAEKAGLRPGDAVVSIDGVKVETVQQLIDTTGQKAGTQVAYAIKRGSEMLQINIIPRVNPPAGSGPLGIQPALVGSVSYPWYQVLYRGAIITFGLLLQILYTFGRLISSLFTDHSLAGSLTGPVGIAVLTRDAARLGLSNLLYFTAVLSVNLAIVNALPFPALDGGRVLFLVIEKLRRKTMNVLVEGYANTIGFFLLIALLVWISVRDVGRYSEQFSHLWQKLIGLFGI